ncbi:transposase [Methanobrevibacter olleyae]|uniref:Transposase n=1 Tax=Methanobrevibacter olleyae TaxID=294671 RepID=A0A126R2X7_METOL|nr:transposase [Methanobrevibacter olleyae]
MTKQNKFVLNTNINFIQLKLFDFKNEKINPNEIIEKRLNKRPKIKNNNQKLFLDENNTFSYVNPVCSVCGSHKIIKKRKK